MHGTEEASNGGKVRVRIIHGLNISHKELTYLLQKSTSHQKPRYYAHAPRGIDWQEKTIARPRPPLIRRTIKEHLMFQICYITFTIRACYGTCKLQHKNFSNSQLLNQHDFDIITSISQNNQQASNFSQYSKHSQDFFTNLEYLAYQGYLRKLPCYLRL